MNPPLPPILLVEDNPMDLDLTLRAFNKRRFINAIEVARDGEEALAYVARWDAGEPIPAVILLDINMPKVNGLEVLEQLKRHPVYRRIPVVVLTSSREDRDIAECYQLGANSYIVKPVEFEKFVEAVAGLGMYWLLLNEPPR